MNKKEKPKGMFALRLPCSLIEALKQEAKYDNVKTTDWVRELLKKEVRQRRKQREPK